MESTLPILTLIPQRPPFVLVDEFHFTDEEHSYSRYLVKEDHVLMENGVLTEGGLVEHIAQTAAARIGYIHQVESKPVPIGYIGAVQDLNVYYLPQAGESLQTSVTVEHQVFNATQVRGKVMSGDKLVAQCALKIFISN
jgi:predicted hotdog family 3-hydroxylacyl-ACP dehydratase